MLAADVFLPNQNEPLVPIGSLLDEELVEKLEKHGVDQVMVRSPIECKTRFGLCANCYGRDLARGHLGINSS